MLKKTATYRHSASASRRLAKSWRMVATLALVLLTLLNAGQGLLCITLDGAHAHQHVPENAEQVDREVIDLNVANTSDNPESSVSTDCLHCAGIHAPLFTLNAEPLAFHVSAASQGFPQIIKQVPPTRLSAHYRPPIYT
jgi:hypothetical protein